MANYLALLHHSGKVEIFEDFLIYESHERKLLKAGWLGFFTYEATSLKATAKKNISHITFFAGEVIPLCEAINRAILTQKQRKTCVEESSLFIHVYSGFVTPVPAGMQYEISPHAKGILSEEDRKKLFPQKNLLCGEVLYS